MTKKPRVEGAGLLEAASAVLRHLALLALSLVYANFCFDRSAYQWHSLPILSCRWQYQPFYFSGPCFVISLRSMSISHHQWRGHHPNTWAFQPQSFGVKGRSVLIWSRLNPSNFIHPFTSFLSKFSLSTNVCVQCFLVDPESPLNNFSESLLSSLLARNSLVLVVAEPAHRIELWRKVR